MTLPYEAFTPWLISRRHASRADTVPHQELTVSPGASWSVNVSRVPQNTFAAFSWSRPFLSSKQAGCFSRLPQSLPSGLRSCEPMLCSRLCWGRLLLRHKAEVAMVSLPRLPRRQDRGSCKATGCPAQDTERTKMSFPCSPCLW